MNFPEVGGEDVSHGGPLDLGIAIVVKWVQLGPSIEHITHVLHALPRRVALVLAWRKDTVLP